MASTVTKPTEPLPPVAHEFHRLVSVRKVTEGGLAQSIAATADELVKIAEFLDVERVDVLRGEISLNRWRAKGLRLMGRLQAEVTQTCVVTLEPVSAHVEAEFERKFLPEGLLAPRRNESDVFVDPIAADPPELLGHDVDLGEILVEELSLNLDPYPRKDGVAFDTVAAEAGVKRESPFAALAKLKRRLEDNK